MKSIPCVRACLTGGLLFTQGLMVAPADTNPARVVVASWNVENLFDADDDPLNPGDDEYTPGGWTRWTEGRYRHKLTNLVDVVHEIRPDILCVMEVENRRVLDDLADLLTERHGFSLPWLSHRDSPDQRGIDTAILSRIKPVDVAWLRPHPLQRDDVIATFSPAGHPFTVLVNHWKSRYGKKAVSDAIR